jgi:anti-anti-sigma regulatory factor
MDDTSSNLRYFISEKIPFAVVSFSGALIKGSLPELKICEQAIEVSQAKVFILCFNELEDLDIQGARALARLQMAIRKKSAAVRLCLLNRRFGRILEDQGALRREELYMDLKDALGVRQSA